MTLSVVSRGEVRVITDRELVEHALQAAGVDLSYINPQLVPYWIKQGKSLREILQIAGVKEA